MSTPCVQALCPDAVQQNALLADRHAALQVRQGEVYYEQHRGH